MAASGLSTLGIKLCYGAYTDSATLPQSVTELGRINAIGEVNLDQESIDASALTDTVTEYVAGRADTGGTWSVTVNVTSETITAWKALQGTTKWFEVIHPSLTDAWFVAATVPAKLPISEIGQNELMTMEINLVLNSYYGLATKVAPATSSTSQ